MAIKKEKIDSMTDDQIIGNAREASEALKTLEKMAEVDVQRSGLLKSWSLNKMTMWHSGDWELVVDFIASFQELEMYYKISVVLDPDNYNRDISRQIEKFKNPQQDLFESGEDYIAKVQKIHDVYAKDAAMFWIFDFTAEVSKYERKTETKQVKFIIDQRVARYFLETVGQLYKTSLVLSKFTSSL